MKKKSQEKDLDKDDKSDKSDKDDKSNKNILSDKLDKKDESDELDKQSMEDNVKNTELEKDDFVDKSDNSKENIDNENKASFFSRLCAFIIDAVIVSMIASLFATPFVDSKKIEDLDNQALSIVEKFRNNEINMNEYVVEYSNISYDLARSNGVVSIITIIIGILYYVVFQLYNNGCTLGKKLLNIRVVSTAGELSMNQMIFRSFIANSLLLDILSMIFITFASKSNYFYGIELFSIIQYAIVIISVFMIMYGKQGLAIHDRLVHTKVIKTK